MIRASFNAAWAAGPALTGFGASPVARPRRWRSAPGGLFEYTKTFHVPAAYREKSVTFEFEGVYRDATVFLNGEFVAQRPNGYTNFYVKAGPYLRYGEPNTIRVPPHHDSRWYTGAGIHHDTKLIVGDLVHVALDGVRITTSDVDAERAVVAIGPRS